MKNLAQLIVPFQNRSLPWQLHGQVPTLSDDHEYRSGKT